MKSNMSSEDSLEHVYYGMNVGGANFSERID